MSIPVRNVYVMLAYASGFAQFAEASPVQIENAELPENYLARVLVTGTDRLLRRGIDREYVAIEDRTSRLRGRILLERLIGSPPVYRRGIDCRFDEHLVDNLQNRIIAETLRRLVVTRGVTHEVRNELVRTIRRLPPLSQISLRANHFSQVRLHRNNRHYRLLLDICRLLYDNLSPDESETGAYRMNDFRRDRAQMGLLFESFLRRFWDWEQQTYRVEHPRFRWHNAEALSDSADMQYLPSMQTDIVLVSPGRQARVVIDAKFYRSPLVTYRNSTMIRPAHLYQLMAYVNKLHREVRPGQEVKGMLLYASPGKPFHLRYRLDGIPVEVRTVDLSQPWKTLKRELLHVVPGMAGENELQVKDDLPVSEQEKTG